VSNGTQQDTGCHLQQMQHAIKSHHLVTWCAPNSDILTTLYFICVCRKLHCKSSAVYNFNLIFYHLSHVDPTRPGHTCKFSDPTRPDPTRGSGQQSCNSVSTEVWSKCNNRFPQLPRTARAIHTDPMTFWMSQETRQRRKSCRNFGRTSGGSTFHKAWLEGENLRREVGSTVGRRREKMNFLPEVDTQEE